MLKLKYGMGLTDAAKPSAELRPFLRTICNEL